MAMQKAVVATDIRGCNEAVKIGENGILVPVKEPVSLAKAISSLLDDPAMADRLAENARLKAEKEFDERLVFDRIKKEYDRLIKEKIR
jgi:N,N'-diacetylbacillosaminyl-diphospho-undecaprenol alpha-1,3-N-acetylgalactosaminyltransferase